MRVFIYESTTGGGTLRTSQQTPCGSLLTEGRAMLTAVAADFAKLDDVQVACLWDERLPTPSVEGVEFESVRSASEAHKLFDHHVSHRDATLVIAPEINGELLEWTRRVERLAGRLLTPDSEFVELTSSKYRTARHLASAGVQVPATAILNKPFSDLPNLKPPLVVKPDDGAGSVGLQRLEEFDFDGSATPDSTLCCVQEFCLGLPASVAVLCGKSPPICLPACWQKLREPGFEYVGGSVIEDAGLSARAVKLASDAVGALPGTRGLIGVDLILGPHVDGSADYVIEVNPRLTTSYVGLRHLSDQNLAHAILCSAQGQSVTLSFRSRRLEFSACGEVRLFPS